MPVIVVVFFYQLFGRAASLCSRRAVRWFASLRAFGTRLTAAAAIPHALRASPA